MQSLKRLRGAPRRITVLAFFIAWALASCAPAPRPGTVPTPPAPGQKPPSRAPSTPPPPREPLRIDREPTLDIGLAVDLDSVRIAARERVTIAVGGGDVEEIGQTIETIGVRRAADRWILWWTSERELESRAIAATDTIWIGREGLVDAVLGWNGKSWRGRLKVFVNPGGKLTLAARLPLETYLLGVVPGEIGGLSEQLLEAGRAQAIAARSYTLFYRGRRGAEGFDLYGTVEDQVYGPIDSERPLATRCVESTRGQVGMSLGEPIRANYYSTCGGITADVWEAWPTDPKPYLVSHRDADGTDWCALSPQYRWREEWPVQDFVEVVSSFGATEGLVLPSDGLGELVDVRVESRSKSGRVWRLAIETTTGRVIVPAYSLRRVLRRPTNHNQILRSNLFKVAVRRDPRTRKAIAVIASGAGSGHGVGLCQTGAIGMARKGESGERILVHYYPGIGLERLY